MLTWFAPVPKSMCVSLIPSAVISIVKLFAPSFVVVTPSPPTKVSVSPSVIAWLPLSPANVIVLLVKLLFGKQNMK